MRNSICSTIMVDPPGLSLGVTFMVSFWLRSRLHSDLQLLFVEQLDFGCPWIATPRMESLGHVLSHPQGHISGSENGGCRMLKAYSNIS